MHFLSLIGFGRKRSKVKQKPSKLDDLILTTLKELPGPTSFDPVWRGYEKSPYGLPAYWGMKPAPPLPWHKRKWRDTKDYWSRMFYAIKAAHKDELYQ